VIAVRLYGREGRIAASLDPAERQAEATARPQAVQAPGAQEISVRRQHPRRMSIAAPIFYSGVRIGEAELALDLSVLVDPIVRSNAQQLAAVAVTVVVLGVAAGVIFVTAGRPAAAPAPASAAGGRRSAVRVRPSRRGRRAHAAFNEMAIAPAKQRTERLRTLKNHSGLNQPLEVREEDAADRREATIRSPTSAVFTHFRGPAHKVVALPSRDLPAASTASSSASYRQVHRRP
jgi:hypothetical protein